MMRRLYNRKVMMTLLSLWHITVLFAQSGYIKGTVTNGVEKLPAATVKFGNKTLLTNTNGEFSFSVKAGSYTLIITHAGYKKIEKHISVKAGETQIYNYTLISVDQLGEVVVLGSRSAIQRSNLNTAVPVDAFSSEKLVETGQLGLIQMLNYSVPSFNTGRQDLYEPVTLRSLDPHHLLILLNGSRYHNSAYLNNGTPKYSLGRGSVTNDLNSIPFSAIEKIEILRDGATAQYGSDAIAGVINIELEKTTGKTSIQLHTGQFYEGDGEKFRLGIYRGFSLNKKGLPAGRKGFLGLSADLRYQAPTTRAGEYINTVYKTFPPNSTASDSARIKAQDDSIIIARGIDKKVFSKYNGINKLVSAGFLVNGGYPIGAHTELFWTSAVNFRENHLAASYRYPKNTNQVDTALFPDGFRADVKITNWDVSAIAGIKGETKNRWHWKTSSSYGSNSNDRHVSNSNNASLGVIMGKNAPTSFYLGELKYKLFTNNINLSKDLAQKDGNLKLCNLATGAEWRIETYQQKAGDEGSWKKYDDTSSSIQGGSQPSIGSVSDTNLVNENRSILGAYIDLEVEMKQNLLFDIAARYEYYSDFGGNLAGKLAVRYKFSEKFSLRGSVSNGFRAPAMQQRFFQGTQSYRGTNLTSGIFNYNNEVTKELLIPSLEAEKSINFSAGITSKISNNISLTMDAYWIQIKDRITLSGVFDRRTDSYVNTVLNGYPDIDVAQFYVNAINTRTYGIDVVLNGRWKVNKTQLGLTLSANFNHNTIFGEIKTTGKVSDTSRYITTLFGIEERTTLEKDQPGEKIILSGTISKGKFGFVFRNTFFGNTATTEIVTTPPPDTLYQSFSSKIITDFSINFTPRSWLTITAAANNIFDIYPERLKYFRINSGGISLYSNGPTPFGSNGGYYYVSMSFSF